MTTEGGHCGSKPKRVAFGIAPLGTISIGIVPMGVICIGVVPMGVVSIGVVAMGVVSGSIVGMGVLFWMAYSLFRICLNGSGCFLVLCSR